MIRISGPIKSDKALAIYLQDHHAGAQAGLALAKRAARNQRGTEAGRVLDDLAAEIEEDETALRKVRKAVGAPPNAVKDVGGKLAERVGRLKLNGQLLGSSPLSPVIELEGLLSGVKSKQHVWMVLRDATDVDTAGVDPQQMIERAEDQLDRLHELWRGFADAAFP
ncbi:MAG: hypothetical protein R3320_08050 [Nitriliruptorales bacterium]|nr:hypothetical protein [Nitriliruptorales bacterium]